ncbi:hypothetical protein CPB86DRAFT_791367 [Serendipita vermifera]|nr:hypothetical protein CPB86DRAFT_791367 [Serendipita vermifera]
MAQDLMIACPLDVNQGAVDPLDTGRALSVPSISTTIDWSYGLADAPGPNTMTPLSPVTMRSLESLIFGNDVNGSEVYGGSTADKVDPWAQPSLPSGYIEHEQIIERFKSKTAQPKSDLGTVSSQTGSTQLNFGNKRIRDHEKLQELINSPSSRLDVRCRRLLEYVLNQDFYKYDVEEPKLGTIEGTAILRHMDTVYGVSFSQGQIKTGRSLFTLLTGRSSYTCLICGTTKTAAQRAVDCVRAHLDHRPFQCTGFISGCRLCPPGQEPARFFSKRLLKEHMDRQQKTRNPKPYSVSRLSRLALLSGNRRMDLN